jgi:hypothetical protein
MKAGKAGKRKLAKTLLGLARLSNHRATKVASANLTSAEKPLNPFKLPPPQ